MKAEELRIGNLFDHYGARCLVQEIKQWGAEFGYLADPSTGFYREYSDSRAFPQPIPLTPEILDKTFGTTIGEPQRWKMVVLEKLFAISKTNNGDYWRIWWNCVHPIYIELEYVHQLQNLFQPLTGTELNVTL